MEDNEQVDFFSIGTNDLTQYTMAANRMNARVKNIFNSEDPAVLRLIGFSLQASYQIYVALVNLATVLISYWCFSKMFASRLSGLLGAALYSLNLYRFTNLYTRAAVGEFSAMAFLPLILYALWAVFMLPLTLFHI